MRHPIYGIGTVSLLAFAAPPSRDREGGVVYHHYVGTAAGPGPGVYKFGWERSSTTKTKGDSISN